MKSKPQPVLHIAQWYAQRVLAERPKPLEPSAQYIGLKLYENLATDKKHYSLLVRDTRADDWQIHFGDYDKHVVVQERDDICANGDYRKINTKIIATYDTQGDINAAVKLLNAPFDPPFTIITITPDNVEHIHNVIADTLGEPKLNRKT